MSKILTYSGQYLNVSGKFLTSAELTDLDGNIYTTVKIGSQVWTVQYLKTTRYSNGSAVNNITDQSAWINTTDGAYCWFNNDYITYAADYGALYNWFAINHDASVPGAALVWLGMNNVQDTRWRVPSVSDISTLTSYVGVDPGSKLKEIGTTYWNSPNSGTNTSGFSAKGTGTRELNGTFDFFKIYNCLWTSTIFSSFSAYYTYLNYNSNSALTATNGKICGYSVRCVRNA